jgi:hypothetical protein
MTTQAATKNIKKRLKTAKFTGMPKTKKTKIIMIITLMRTTKDKERHMKQKKAQRTM